MDIVQFLIASFFFAFLSKTIFFTFYNIEFTRTAQTMKNAILWKRFHKPVLWSTRLIIRILFRWLAGNLFSKALSTQWSHIFHFYFFLYWPLISNYEILASFSSKCAIICLEGVTLWSHWLWRYLWPLRSLGREVTEKVKEARTDSKVQLCPHSAACQPAMINSLLWPLAAAVVLLEPLTFTLNLSCCAFCFFSA